MQVWPRPAGMPAGLLSLTLISLEAMPAMRTTEFHSTCPECGAFMEPTSSRWVMCPHGHGKLYPRCKGFNEEIKKLKKQGDLPAPRKKQK